MYCCTCRLLQLLLAAHTQRPAAAAAAQAFLADNGLRLIIRSHEGPDARDKRQEGDRMPSVDSGYAVDHDTHSECVLCHYVCSK
jgi:hypothetical protein